MYQSRACCPGKLLMSSMSFDLFIRAHTPHALLTKYTPEYNNTVLCSAPVRSTTATSTKLTQHTHSQLSAYPLKMEEMELCHCFVV